MTPKEKAKELLIKMEYIEGELMAMNYIAKRHALIAVDEILKDNPFDVIKLQYWGKVKQEINEL